MHSSCNVFFAIFVSPFLLLVTCSTVVQQFRSLVQRTQTIRSNLLQIPTCHQQQFHSTLLHDSMLMCVMRSIWLNHLCLCKFSCIYNKADQPFRASQKGCFGKKKFAPAGKGRGRGKCRVCLNDTRQRPGNSFF